MTDIDSLRPLRGVFTFRHVADRMTIDQNVGRRLFKERARSIARRPVGFKSLRELSRQTVAENRSSAEKKYRSHMELAATAALSLAPSSRDANNLLFHREGASARRDV